MTLDDILSSPFTGVRLMGRRIIAEDKKLDGLGGLEYDYQQRHIDAMIDYAAEMQARHNELTEHAQ